MPYTPLDADLLSSTLLREGPDVVSAFMLILASRDRFGETAIQPSTVASLLRITDERAEEAFRVLSSPDPKSRNEDSEGRRIVPIEQGRWRIVSFEKYQRQASKAAAAERQRKHRERVKQAGGPAPSEDRVVEDVSEFCSTCGCEATTAAAGLLYCDEHMPVEAPF